MKKYKILFVIAITITVGCRQDNKLKKEIHHKKRDNIIKLNKKISDINPTKSFGTSLLYIIDDYLLVHEIKPTSNKCMHFFDKTTFNYIKSTGFIGKGPGEITRPGRIGINHKSKLLWVQDHGKQVIWEFPLDSIINSKNYIPKQKVTLNNTFFIERFGFINDSIALGKAIKVINNSSFEMKMAKLNINTNQINNFGYEHPINKNKKSYSSFKLSNENNIYINAYTYSDLVTICDLQGNLKFNILGPDWLKNSDNKNAYYSGVDVIDDYIIASYIGDKNIIYNKHKRPIGNLPSKFLVYDINGNYIKTLETGSKIQTFCTDEENNRIIILFADRRNSLGYINLDQNNPKL